MSIIGVDELGRVQVEYRKLLDHMKEFRRYKLDLGYCGEVACFRKVHHKSSRCRAHAQKVREATKRYATKTSK